MDGFLIGMVITGLCGLLITALGFYMMITGRGSFLIAGFNTMPKEQKEKYDSNAMSKFIGRIVLVPVGILTVLFALGLTFGVRGSEIIPWLLWFTIIAYTVIVTVISIFAVIYFNTGNRFRK